MRKFLYTIVVLIVLVAAVLLVLRIWWDDLAEIALVPTSEFVEQDPLASNAYHDPDMWFSRPGMGAPNDPARWQPPERSSPAEAEATAAAEPQSAASPEIAGGSGTPPEFAVFFVHPTSFYDNRAWNAALDDPQSRANARVLVRGLASPFNSASEIWAPRYRQATFGAFLSESDAAERAIEAAYRDIAQAFDYFVESIDDNMPIVLAGHSQGAFHVLRLLREEIIGTPLESRIAMVYPIGWPISIEHDLPALGLPACATPRQGSCIMSWSSFAEPAEPGPMLERYASSPGLDGMPRSGSQIVCVNPITGMLNDAAPASRNLGTLVPSEDLSTGELLAGAVPARCDERGLLLIGDPPELGPYTLPGNNYHVYVIPLFWRNLQEDVVTRVSAWSSN